jgi:exonuclease SbcD
MKILHTADWHIGKRLERFFRLEEQKMVLQEICDIADREKVDAIVIAGDLFDTFNPPTEAVDLFYKILKRLSRNGRRAVVAIAGNHDSPDRIEAPDPLARECGIILTGYPNSVVVPFSLETGLAVTRSEEGFLELKLPENKTPLRILLTPYANENRLKICLGFEDNAEEELRTLLQQKWQALAKKYCNKKGVNLLVAHLFMMKKGETPPEEPEDEKPILHVGGAQAVYTENIPKQIQYVALGHLHRKQQLSKKPCPIYYSSSPLSYSMSEAEQEKYVIIVEAEAGEAVAHRAVPLTQGKKLLRATFESVDKAVSWLEAHPDTLVEITLTTESFLTVEERKRLNEAHKGIVAIIPQVKSAEREKTGAKAEIDLDKKMEELFSDYFRYKYEQAPNEEILRLFREIVAEEEE